MTKKDLFGIDANWTIDTFTEEFELEIKPDDPAILEEISVDCDDRRQLLELAADLDPEALDDYILIHDLSELLVKEEDRYLLLGR